MSKSSDPSKYFYNLWYNDFGDNMNEYMPIILTIVVITGALSLVYIIFSSNLKACKIKVFEAENVLHEVLKEKYDLLVSMQYIIAENIEIDSKVFEKLKQLEKQNLSIFNYDEKLSENVTLVQQIKDDYKEIKKNESIDEIMHNLLTVDEKLEATKSFYNKYATELNTLRKKFPTNIIAKLSKGEHKAYFKWKPHTVVFLSVFYLNSISIRPLLFRTLIL